MTDVNVPSIAEAVAAVLGPEWRLGGHDAERGHWAHLVRENGAELSVSCLYPERKLHWTGVFPTRNGRPGGRGYDYGPYDPKDRGSIYTSATRNPGAIARDLAARLLPVYLPAYAKAQARQAETEALRDRARAAAQDLARRLGVVVQEQDDRFALATWWAGTHHDSARADITVFPGGDVSLKIERLAPVVAAIIVDGLARRSA